MIVLNAIVKFEGKDEEKQLKEFIDGFELIAIDINIENKLMHYFRSEVLDD